MKRKFLILSATLLAVCSAALLQSCSSEYEYYDATEEYGYYTEEEISAIESMAEKYDLNIEMDFSKYTRKKSIEEFEKKFQALSTLKGEYEVAPTKKTDGTINYVSSRRITPPREETSLPETGSWSGSRNARREKKDGYITYYESYSIDVSITWNLQADIASQRIKGSADILGLNNTESKISCSLLGSEAISFSGSVSGEETDDDYNIIKYSFSISDGEVNRKTNMGSFTVK